MCSYSKERQTAREQQLQEPFLPLADSRRPARPGSPPLFPSGDATTMPTMVHALLTCSEGECTDTYEVYGPLEEVEAVACKCGCGLAIVGWPDTADCAASLGSAVELLPLAA